MSSVIFPLLFLQRCAPCRTHSLVQGLCSKRLILIVDLHLTYMQVFLYVFSDWMISVNLTSYALIFFCYLYSVILKFQSLYLFIHYLL